MAVKAACAARGLRLTPIREQVLGLVARSGKPVKAYDLLERMQSEVGANAPPTVYRALDFLLANGFIHKLASINAFVELAMHMRHWSQPLVWHRRPGDRPSV